MTRHALEHGSLFQFVEDPGAIRPRDSMSVEPPLALWSLPVDRTWVSEWEQFDHSFREAESNLISLNSELALVNLRLSAWGIMWKGEHRWKKVWLISLCPLLKVSLIPDTLVRIHGCVELPDWKICRILPKHRGRLRVCWIQRQEHGLGVQGGLGESLGCRDRLAFIFESWV